MGDGGDDQCEGEGGDGEIEGRHFCFISFSFGMLELVVVQLLVGERERKRKGKRGYVCVVVGPSWLMEWEACEKRISCLGCRGTEVC